MTAYRAVIYSEKLNPVMQVFCHDPDYARGWIRGRLAELKDPKAVGRLVEISEKEIACFHYATGSQESTDSQESFVRSSHE